MQWRHAERNFGASDGTANALPMAAILMGAAALRLVALLLGTSVQVVSSSAQVVSSGGDIDATYAATRPETFRLAD